MAGTGSSLKLFQKKLQTIPPAVDQTLREVRKLEEEHQSRLYNHCVYSLLWV